MSRRYRHIILLGLLICACIAPDYSYTQNELGTDNTIVNDSKREEIQRYFGYELLIYRYLSLPYDVSVSINQQGNFVDISILYILFIPILVLLFMGNKLWLRILTILYLLFTWVIATSNSFLFSMSQGSIDNNPQAFKQYLSSTSFGDEPFAHILAYIYKLALTIYTPFEALGQSISGDSDYITYPIIFSAFILVSLMIAGRISSMEPKLRGFLIFFWTYSFYWFAFSGGIVWYGYILLLMGLFLIPFLINLLKERSPIEAGKIHKLFLVCGCIWIFFALAYRTSDIQPMMDKKYFAKGLFNPVYYDYGAGKIDEEKSIEVIYPGLNTALQKINSDNGLILRVGTTFNYFIKNNHKRVVEDNQLSLFHELYARYPDNLTLIDVLKANGVKYILFDLNTASIDFTPDKSLTSKYSEMLRFVVNNPYLKLLATDRVVANKDANGQPVYTRNIYGAEIYQFGRFAIFEIV